MPSIAELLSQELSQKLEYIENVIALMDEGNTIPFICGLFRSNQPPCVFPSWKG